MKDLIIENKKIKSDITGVKWLELKSLECNRQCAYTNTTINIDKKIKDLIRENSKYLLATIDGIETGYLAYKIENDKLTIFTVWADQETIIRSLFEKIIDISQKQRCKQIEITKFTNETINKVLAELNP